MKMRFVLLSVGLPLTDAGSSARATAGTAPVCIDEEGTSQELTCGWPADSPSRITARMDPRFSDLPASAQAELLQLQVCRRNAEATFDALRFYSAYGTSRACLLCVVPGGEPFVALTTTYGHGANVRRERLSLYDAKGESIEPVLTLPVSGSFGYGTGFYRQEFVDLNGDGDLDLRLVLEHTPIEESTANNPALPPRTRLAEYL